MKKIFEYKTLILICFAFVLYILVHSIGLFGSTHNGDASRWYLRSARFAEALKTGNLFDTYQRYHPGVTLMWLTAISEYGLKIYDSVSDFSISYIGSASDFFVYDFYHKLVLILALGFIFALQVFYILKIFGFRTAIIYIFISCSEPYLLGINKWFHLTGLEASLVFTSFLSLIYYLKYKSRRELILVSPILLALAVLTKMTSVTILPTFLLCTYIFLKDYKKVIQNEIIYVLILIFAVFVLFPALWVDPAKVFNNLFTAAKSAVTEDSRGEVYQGVLSLSYYPSILMFKLSLATLLLGIISIIKVLALKKDINWLILLYIFNYYVVLTLSDQKIDRYALVFFPPLLLLVANLLAEIKIKYAISYITFCIMFLIIASSVYKNNLSAFYSPLLGGTKKALDLGLYDNSGEFYNTAALYLNSQEKPSPVYVPDNLNSFVSLYKGRSTQESTDPKKFVLRSLDTERLAFDEETCTTIVKQFGGDFPVVAIYACLD